MLFNFMLHFGLIGMSVISTSLSLILIVLACGSHLFGKRRSRGSGRGVLGVHVPRASVSIIVPVYNEESVLSVTLNPLRQIAYADYEIIVVNDGSTDASLKILMDMLQLHEVSITTYQVSKSLPHKPIIRIFQSHVDHRIRVLDKANGGKFDALNAGIALSSHPWFCCIDADTIPMPDALDKMMSRVESDPTIIGLAGQVRVGNRWGMNRFWVPVQTVEYIRSFVMERIGWSALQGLVTIPGAFSLFNKQAVCEVGGYSPQMPTEDLELVLKLYHHYLGQNRVYRIEYAPEAVAFTEVPTNINSMVRQRGRWYRGLWIAICHHRHMICRPRYKIIGLFVLPYILLFELLWPVLGTVIFLILSSVNLLHQPARAHQPGRSSCIKIRRVR